jgi:hypothetical protein
VVGIPGGVVGGGVADRPDVHCAGAPLLVVPSES